MAHQWRQKLKLKQLQKGGNGHVKVVATELVHRLLHV